MKAFATYQISKDGKLSDSSQMERVYSQDELTKEYHFFYVNGAFMFGPFDKDKGTRIVSVGAGLVV